MHESAVVRSTLEMEEGAGARVRRLFPVPGFANFDPFVLWDHFDLAPGTGFPSHSHRGFEAITYLFAGTMRHEDNLGNRSTVARGGAQRFTAGRGIVHSEMPAQEGETRGIQLWVNLPRRLKSVPASYEPTGSDELAETSRAGVTVRTIVGEGSPVRLHTPVRYLDVQLVDGRFSEHLPAGYKGFVYMVEGAAQVLAQTVEQGAAVFLDHVPHLQVDSRRPCRFMVCFGIPYGEPIIQSGPNVD